MSTVMDMITQKNKEKMAQKKEEAAERISPPEEGNAPMQRPKPMVSVVQPVRTSPAEVIFRSVRPNFAFFMNGSRVQFKNSFLCTDDEDIILYIKKTYVGSFVKVIAEGPLVQEEDKE